MCAGVISYPRYGFKGEGGRGFPLEHEVWLITVPKYRQVFPRRLWFAHAGAEAVPEREGVSTQIPNTHRSQVGDAQDAGPQTCTRLQDQHILPMPQFTLSSSHAA